jgi:paraquat-inducible protein A
MLTVSTTGSINAKTPHVESGFMGIPSVKGTEQHHMQLKVFDTTRSILKTVHDLWQKDYLFVSAMIFLFSIIVPFAKGILVIYSFFAKDAEVRVKVYKFVNAIGKWSMCDVFIVAVFLSYLSTGATQTENTKNMSIMGHPINVDVMAGMHAQLQIGFWCFLAYCLLSLLALQLYEPDA